MLVRDVMTKNPITVDTEEKVLEAKKRMTDGNVSRLPVTDKSGLLCGIITLSDLNRFNPDSATSLDMYELSYLLNKVKVKNVMHKDVTTISGNLGVEEAARLMEEHGIGCLPVMDGEILVGIVTQDDLFECFVKMFSMKNAGVRAEIILDEKPGQLAQLADAIAAKKGNVVSLVTADCEDQSKRKVTVKVTGISSDDVVSMVKSAGGIIEDVREV